MPPSHKVRRRSGKVTEARLLAVEAHPMVQLKRKVDRVSGCEVSVLSGHLVGLWRVPWDTVAKGLEVITGGPLHVISQHVPLTMAKGVVLKPPRDAVRERVLAAHSPFHLANMAYMLDHSEPTELNLGAYIGGPRVPDLEKGLCLVGDICWLDPEHGHEASVITVFYKPWSRDVRRHTGPNVGAFVLYNDRFSLPWPDEKNSEFVIHTAKIYSRDPPSGLREIPKRIWDQMTRASQGPGVLMFSGNRMINMEGEVATVDLEENEDVKARLGLMAPAQFKYAVILQTTPALIPVDADTVLAALWPLLAAEANVYLFDTKAPYHVLGFVTLASAPILHQANELRMFHWLRKAPDDFPHWAINHLGTARTILGELGATTDADLVVHADKLFRLVPEDVLDHEHSVDQLVYLALCSAKVEERVHLPIYIRRLEEQCRLEEVEVARIFGLKGVKSLARVAWEVSGKSAIVRSILLQWGLLVE